MDHIHLPCRAGDTVMIGGETFILTSITAELINAATRITDPEVINTGDFQLRGAGRKQVLVTIRRIFSAVASTLSLP